MSTTESLPLALGCRGVLSQRLSIVSIFVAYPHAYQMSVTFTLTDLAALGHLSLKGEGTKNQAQITSLTR